MDNCALGDVSREVSDPAASLAPGSGESGNSVGRPSGLLMSIRDTPMALAREAWRDRSLMPKDFTISLAAKGAADRGMVRPQPATQSLAGFDPSFSDIVDYILRVTHGIWEEKGIGYLYEYYRFNADVTDDHGIVYGRDKVIEDTTAFISAFPDLRLFADEIVWCGNDQVGFWTSHRAVMVGHNTGYSAYGPPTGRKVVVTAIANCFAKDNQISEEFVIYNRASLLRQLGLDLYTEAQHAAANGGQQGLDEHRAGEVERLLGQGSPMQMPRTSGDGFDVEDFVRRSQHEIWNWRMLNRIDDAYVSGFRFHGPTDRHLYGTGQYKAYVLSLMSMFPDLAFTIDDLYWMGNDANGYVVAMRWTVAGTHRGPGYYRTPTGRRVHMWGITHYSIVRGRIVEEWTVSNEFDVLQQLVSCPPGADSVCS